MQISGSVATVGSTVRLTDYCYQKTDHTNVPDPWIQGNELVGANDLCKHRFGYWSYPKGGNPVSALPLDIAPTNSYGEAVSE